MSRLFQLLLLHVLFRVSHALTPSLPYANDPVNLTNAATLYHEANFQSDSIRLAIIITDPAVVTSSVNWLGMGIGEPTSGSMIGADIVTAQFASNATVNCTIQDRYVPFTAYPLGEAPAVFPLEDTCKRPDWRLVSCVRDVAEGTMLLEVTRSLSVTDEKQDRPIVPGQNAFMYAYGSPFTYHGERRHSAEITFYEDPSNPPPSLALPDDVDGSFDISATAYEIPADRDTVYACTSRRIPGIGKGTDMIIAAEPIFNSSDADSVHHFTLFMCGGDEYARQTSKTIACDLEDGPSGPLGNPKSGCSMLVYGYAKGAARFVYPPEVGVTVTPKQPYLVMETHFDNPEKRAGLVDHSGIRLYYTSTKRKHSASSLAIGDSFVSRAPDFVRNGFKYQNSCPSECTDKFSQNITIFSSFLHMHTTGREIYTNLYHRNNSFVETVNKVNFWSDSFQKFMRLPRPVQLQPGQRLQLVCEFDTTKRPNTTFGITTRDEMCLDFLLYWPAQTDAVTGHDINTCSYVQNQAGNMTFTACGDHARVDEMFAENAIGFPTNVSNPTFNDTVGAPTAFGMDGAVCALPSPTPAVTANGTNVSDPSVSGTIEPEQNETSNECFPAFATATKRDGSKIRMDKLSIGDIVAVGGGRFSPVFLFTHSDPMVRSEMVALKTEQHGTLTVSKGHYVYGNGSLKPARQVSVGEHLKLHDGQEVRVVATELVKTVGLFNPQTVHGDIIVDGFASSTFTTAVEPVLATALLTPLRWAFPAIRSLLSLLSHTTLLN